MAKASLDLAVRPTGETWQVANEAAGLPELIAQLSALPPALVVLEATGGYEHLVVAALATAGLPVVVADPRQVRDFGRAVGQLAKTDRIDAALLALFAERVGPEPRPLPDEASCKMLVTQLLAHMSDMTYTGVRAPGDKPLVWLHGEIKTPPFSREARVEAGVLLRRLQAGEKLALPHSRPMPSVGARCHELRIPDAQATRRYRVQARFGRRRHRRGVQQEDGGNAPAYD